MPNGSNPNPNLGLRSIPFHASLQRAPQYIHCQQHIQIELYQTGGPPWLMSCLHKEPNSSGDGKGTSPSSRSFHFPLWRRITKECLQPGKTATGICYWLAPMLFLTHLDPSHHIKTSLQLLCEQNKNIPSQAMQGFVFSTCSVSEKLLRLNFTRICCC